MVKYLKEENLIPSARQLALKIEVHPQCISDIMTGKRSVNSDIIEKCAQNFDINLNYLYRGTGEIMNSKDLVHNDVLTPNNHFKERIAYVPIAAQAGYIEQFLDDTFLEDLVSFSLPDSRYQHGSYRCFDVVGDSMEPSIYSGDKLICQNVEQQYWMNSIKNNYVYVIVSNEGVIVKRVINQLATTRSLSLISDNSFYTSTEILASDIREVWIVTSKISSFMQSPNNIKNGLDKVVDNLKDTIHDQSKLIQSLNTTIEKLLKQNRLARA
jgi:phage repressor protein C with HTH and peptisase S24 domain